MKELGQLKIYMENNENGFLAPHTKINPRWIKCLHIKCKLLNFQKKKKKKNRKVFFSPWRGGKKKHPEETKSMNKKEIKNLYSSKGKDKPQTGRRHMQYTDPQNEHTEYTRNSYKY